MIASTLSLLALASSALAITVTTPEGWTSTGPNKLEFKAVSTDPTSFAVILVNQNTTLLSEPIVLVKNQSTSSTEITVSPGCGDVKTLPVGGSFQISFVSNTQNLNSIIAQSQSTFNITQGSGSSSCASSTAGGASASQTAGGSQTGAGGSAASASATKAAGAGFSTTSLSSSAIALAFLGLAGFSLL